MKKKQEVFDDSFYRLANSITKALEENDDGSTQEQQVDELMDAEKKFKAVILKYRQSTEIYKKFLQKIRIQNKNILSARPYFRENSVTFSKKITPAIKDEDIETLKTFDINFLLIKFIKENWLGPFPKRALELYRRVERARTILLENNMPLAINRAKIFYRKTPRSHLSLMDLIEICAMGLASGIDKYVGKYTTVFRSVCIGRMVGNMIDAYSETTVHFYPSDKRVLYKANSIKGRQGISDIEELTKAVNESFKQDSLEGKSVPKNEITVSELNGLMAAAGAISIEGATNEFGLGVYDYMPDEAQDVETDLIEKEAISTMLAVAKKLPLLHRKVLRLKGIRI